MKLYIVYHVYIKYASVKHKIVKTRGNIGMYGNILQLIKNS